MTVASDNSYRRNSRPELLEFVPEGVQRALDVGCGEGDFGSQLKIGGNAEIWGIEIDHSSATVAQGRLDRVLIGDITHLWRDLPDGYFDCIFFNDVLEHLINPGDVLLHIKRKLSPVGCIVCSIPNVRYYHTLRDLVVYKKWHYEDEGILDRTHLRFFTESSIQELFDTLDFEILKMKGINPLADSWSFAVLNTLLLGHLSDCRYLQFAIVAIPK